jgi:hypothetical protein
MRVLFIDADGVLHPEPPRSGFHRLCWLPHLVELLAPYPDVRVVVHSSWRLDMPQDYIARLMAPLGAQYAGVTKGAGREASIRAWLKESAEKVRSYRVLDDMPREFREGWTELIICPSREGLTHPGVQAKLRDWLQN